MKQQHIILIKNTRSSLLDPFTGPSYSERRNSPGGFLQEAQTDLAIESIEKKEIEELRRDPNVIGLAPAMPVHLIEPVHMNENMVSEQESPVSWGVEAVGATRSHFTGKGIKVAILDTGIDDSHEAFDGIQLVKRNFTNEDERDQNGHGTHVAGTIFGKSVNGFRIGVAQGIETAIIGKVLGTGGGSTEKIFQAIQWAGQKGATIISMSLGIDFPGYVKQLVDVYGFPADLATSRALEGYRANILLYSKLADLLRVQGSFSSPSLLVAAAGNESKREISPDYEIATAPPAASDGVFSVGALQQSTTGLKVADFSNTGPDISAPGVGIISAKKGGGVISYNGTSMATPHVTGVMALWAEKLANENQLNHLNLVAKAIGYAGKSQLSVGYDSFDIGAGIIQSP